jgi:hypothetical protein
MNLFDIMRSAGGGDAFAALAKQYGLTPEQMTKAVGALMPGLSAGLTRNASDPFGLTQLLGTMARPDYARAYSDPAWALTGGRRKGEEALAMLFGSKEVAEKTAELAAAYSGLAQETLEKLQAPLAAMMLGGLAKQSSAGNPLLDAMLKHVREAGAASRKDDEAPKAKGPLDRYEEEQERRERDERNAAGQAMRETFEAGLAGAEAAGAAWQDAISAMLEGKPVAWGEADRPSGADLFGDMLEPGIRLSEDYQRQVSDMLERLSGSGKEPGGKG